MQLHIDEKEIILAEKCPIHGEYNVTIRADNSTFIDLNTQLRDLSKGVLLIEEDKKNNTLSIMVDGNDWAGTWAQRIHIEGMIRLGYTEFVMRLFTPTILDWSGAKLSKSLYVKNGIYTYIHPAFLNYDDFIKYFDIKGLEILWNEVQNWVEEPKKFFRNYTIEYFYSLFELRKVSTFPTHLEDI